MYASIITDIKSNNVNKVYDYEIPEKFQDFLEVGMRVIVPFGSQTRLGYVIRLSEESDFATKKIIEVLDTVPIISKEMFEIAKYLEDTNIYPYASILETIIPSEFTVKYQKKAVLLNDDTDESLKLKFNKNFEWIIKPGDSEYFSTLRKEIKKGNIKIETEILQKETEKLETAYTYNFDNTYQRKSKYDDILTIFSDDETQTRKNMLANGFTSSIINTLLKNNCLIEKTSKRLREVKHKFGIEEKKVILNDEQKNAYYKIADSLNQNKTYLLKGITGSGKTEIYLELIKKVIDSGKTAIILVPEISLIAPLAQRLKSRFFEVAIISSSLSQGERHDEWLRIKRREADVVLGTRSAIFSPLENIGIIIIDEEHDKSYQQEESVIYDALEIAGIRSVYHNIPLVLGSATPSIKDMYLANTGKYELLELKKMAQKVEKPDIELVDMRKELTSGNISMFSERLKGAINDRLNKNEQIILLFNRKGYAPFVLCRTCGYVPSCPNCDVSLTYYKRSGILKCHYCGHEEKFNDTCPVCKKKTIREVGAGIELVQEKIETEFPSARILRMDANTTLKKGTHEGIWLDFKNQKADILLGTQMIAKGFDFDNVSLVGVLMADTMLKVPSYLASEETFTLLTQVIGRSGRKIKGEAVIQGYNIDNYAISSVLKGYDAFYNEALKIRKSGKYEPFSRINQIVVEGNEYFKTYKYAYLLKSNILKSSDDLSVLGPAEALLSKIKNRYRFTITLKYDNNEAEIIKKIKDEINKLSKPDFIVHYYRFQSDFN